MINMKSVDITFRVEEDLKAQAELLFADLGMSLSTAFNIFLRQSIREQQIPFAISKNVPNAVTQAAMESAEQDKDLYGPFDSVEALMEALNA
jgi:DNA-damage-inducible protein J